MDSTLCVLDVCTAFDKSFVVPANVMMRSAAINSTQKIHFHLLVPKSEFKKNSNLFMPVDLPTNSVFTIYEVEDTSFSKYISMKGTLHFSNAAIFRLFMTDYLPISIDTILYLDADLVINLDISEIFSSYSENVFSAKIERLDDGYFNSGVFLTSLNFWHHQQIKSQALNFLVRNPSLKYKDQDCLNHIFNSYNIPLDKKFNSPLSDFRIFHRKQTTECIFHFTGTIKPWKKHAPNVFPVKLWRSVYFEIYKKRAPLQNTSWSFLKRIFTTSRMLVKI